jgi:nitrate/nitrite transporter NarK
MQVNVQLRHSPSVRSRYPEEMAVMTGHSKLQQGMVLGMSTFAFTVCFMIWMMFAILGVPIKELLSLNETQFGLLVATPVLTGSLIRLPLGMLTDKFGGRIVFFVLMMVCVMPIYFISHATLYWHFLVLGLFVGLAGGSFSVGIAYVAKWFDKEEPGFCHGHLWCRQCRCCRHQVCSTCDHCGIQLADGP